VKDNFAFKLDPTEINESDSKRKLLFISNFVKLDLEERKKYFMNSRYEISSFEEKIEKVDGFNQQNFQNLIERCRMFLKNGRDDKVYIEKIKEEIIKLEMEKNAIIEKTKLIIDELKSDNLKLIDKIESLSKEKDKVDIERIELFKKTEEINRKVNENNILKIELEKSKVSFNKEKNKIVINKDKEISQLCDKLNYSSKFEKNLTLEQKEKYKLKNISNELKTEVQRLTTVLIKI
jgi:hypothetical protein